MDYKSEILNRYPKSIQDKTLSSEKTVEFFIKNPLYLQRTICNPFAVSIYSFILSRCLSNINKNYDIDGYVYVTTKDIANNLHYSKGVISKTISKLVRCELLYVDKKTTKRGIYNYYKINQVMSDILCLEDTTAWHFCTSNQIEPSKEELDSRCPMKVSVREMFDTENPDFYNVLKRLTNFEKPEKYLGGVFTLCTRGGFHVMTKGFSRYDQGVFTLCAPTIDKYTKEKITTDKAFTKVNAQTFADASVCTNDQEQNQSKVQQEESPCFNLEKEYSQEYKEKEEQELKQQILASLDQEYNNSPCINKTNNILANSKEEENCKNSQIDVGAAAENSQACFATLAHSPLASRTCPGRKENNLNFNFSEESDLVPAKEVKMQNSGQKQANNPENPLFFNDSNEKLQQRKERKLAKTEALEKYRQSNPDFMRVYDAWVEAGFTAHDPSTATFKKALADFEKVKAGKLFDSIIGMDQFARPYGARTVIKAIKNFALAFDINYEPRNKKWLDSRRSLAKFFYDPNLFNNKSLFIQFLEPPALLAPLEKSEESKYKEKYGIDYCYMPDWFEQIYEESVESGNSFDDEKAPRGEEGIAFFFAYYLDRESYYENCFSFGELKFGYSDLKLVIDKWLKHSGYEKYIDEEDGMDRTPYGKALDAMDAIIEKVKEMGNERISRGHLFSDRLWEMIFEQK